MVARQGLPETAASGRRGFIDVHVARSDVGARRQFRVPLAGELFVLDLLLSLQHEHDASLGFRFSCRVAMCGTCTVQINGRPHLACNTPLPDAPAIRIAPLAGFPVVRDLIVDRDPFIERWAAVRPYLHRVDADGPDVSQASAVEREIIDRSLDCISCGACFAACPIADSGRDFLGPAALLRLMVLAADSRADSLAERLSIAGGPDGVDRCHSVGACTAVCPRNLDPLGGIQRLRQWRIGLRQPLGEAR